MDDEVSWREFPRSSSRNKKSVVYIEVANGNKEGSSEPTPKEQTSPKENKSDADQNEEEKPPKQKHRLSKKEKVGSFFYQDNISQHIEESPANPITMDTLIQSLRLVLASYCALSDVISTTEVCSLLHSFRNDPEFVRDLARKFDWL